LAGIKPKDYDLVTNATPEAIKSNIDRAFIIGKRFRLVLVKRGAEQYEVATFRKDPPPEESLNEDGQQVSDNVFGSEEEDARRRDFTINSMFYDPIKDEVTDYCGGLQDIDRRMIRVIGDPKTRLTEDPIRILRALRLAHKLEFSIEASLREAMVAKAELITASVLPRRREEMLKILRLNDPVVTLHEAHDLGILKHAFPLLDTVYSEIESIDEFDSYISRMPEDADPLIPETAFLFGVLILAFVRSTIQRDPLDTQIQLNEHKRLNEFLKHELGAFNHEISMVLRAFEIQSELQDISGFKKRGHRRKAGLLKNDALPLALLFAEMDHSLPPNGMQFWKEELDRIRPELEQQREGDRPVRRVRRRFRRPRTLGTKSV
jgi:poly(A) polymerase